MNCIGAAAGLWILSKSYWNFGSSRSRMSLLLRSQIMPLMDMFVDVFNNGRFEQSSKGRVL